MKRILLIDGQGGRLGASLTQAILTRFPACDLTCVGTNSLATAAMLKAGAKKAATGENAVIVCARRADIIIGPIGIVIADSMLGEITPSMASAVGAADAIRILIPQDQCQNLVVGVEKATLTTRISQALDLIESQLGEEL